MNQSHRNEKGFALPLTLLLVTMLTVMLTSAFTRMGTEIETAGASEVGVEALAVAQSGLETYFGTDVTTRPISGDSTRYNVTGGYAWIVPEVLHTPTDTMSDFRYIVRSTGYVIHPNQGATPLASRTVAQMADWQQPWLSAPPAAIIAANDLHVMNHSGTVTVSGSDRLSCGGTAFTPVMGMRIPVQNDDYSQAVITGSPAVTELDTQSYVAGLTGIDWSTIVNGGFEADYTSVQNGATVYSSQMITGNYRPSADVSGKGLLIVTGDLIPTSNYWTWEGIVLVGDKFDARDVAYLHLYGALVSGLDADIGGSPRHSDLGGGAAIDQTVQFDSCAIKESLAGQAGFLPLGNTWVGNWAEWGN